MQRGRTTVNDCCLADIFKISLLSLLLTMLMFLCSECSAAAAPAIDETQGNSTGSSPSGDYDGPAELPRIYIQTSLADTPAPGAVIFVDEGADLQQALNRASCGDTIELQAGATFTGSFNFPAKNCDDAHWIIVRTSAPDSSLPPQMTRISPCYAGVASLPGRPAFNCPSTNNVMAKIEYPGSNTSGPIFLQNGANHYRFIGLEITRTPLTGLVYNLVVNQNNGAAKYVFFDRCWLHGTPHDETQRGVLLSATSYTAVIDSYFSDFHCVAITGACVDSSTIAVGLGPVKIVDDFLEASGENILFGGGAASVTPADIEISRNHLFKPLLWMLGQPGYVGGFNGNPFIVKNLFELKNAQRVLFEANVLDDSWGGFSQTGFAILLTPKNQASGTTNVCPICEVTDVTIRYVTISHVGGGLQIGNALSDNGGAPLAGLRYSIHDIIVDDISETKYDGSGLFAQISTAKGAPVLQDVTINHVTAFPHTVLLNLGDFTKVQPPMQNFVFINNIVNAGWAPTLTTGGGPANCAYYDEPLTTLGACFQPYTFSHNAIIATPPTYPPTQYPSGNFFAATPAAVGFVNYNNGDGGNYELTSTSPYKNAGTDGKDLGADVEFVEAEIAGVI